MKEIAILLVVGALTGGALTLDQLIDPPAPTVKRGGGSCAEVCGPCPRGGIDYSDPYYTQSCAASNGKSINCADYCAN